MGKYDSKINALRTDVYSLNSEIKKCKNEISELESMIEKCDAISSKVEDAVNTILSNIDKKAITIPGNFTSYFKDNITRITNENSIHDVSGMTVSDKNRIKKKIIDLEDKKRHLRLQINSKQGDISYFQSLNTEMEE